MLLLEAGGSDKRARGADPGRRSTRPGAPGRDWNYTTEPQPGLDGRELFWPRGKLLGGSSSINAMIYIRGAAADYDEWAQLTGDKAWSYEHVLPLFRRMEDNARGADRVPRRRRPAAGRGPALAAPVDAAPSSQSAVAAGYPRNDDFNGATQEGVGQYQVTQKRGRRWSSADAYLHPAHGAAQPDRAHRRADHPRAGRGRPGHRRRVPRRRPACTPRGPAREVVLSGGAINTPQLLMLSGIGPADHLREVGVDVVHDLPGRRRRPAGPPARAGDLERAVGQVAVPGRVARRATRSGSAPAAAR